jgi:hypothetical protein
VSLNIPVVRVCMRIRLNSTDCHRMQLHSAAVIARRSSTHSLSFNQMEIEDNGLFNVLVEELRQDRR